MSALLDDIMPIPSRTLARGHPWTSAARAYIYEGVNAAPALGALIGKSAARVRNVRSQDKWREFREQASARQTADRMGLQLPFLLREQSLKGEIEREGDDRAGRAADIRAELTDVLAAMKAQRDKGAARYSRLVQTAAALQMQLDALLGLDVVKRVGTATAIARAKSGTKPRPACNLPNVRPRIAPPVAPSEPDVMSLAPLD